MGVALLGHGRVHPNRDYAFARQIGAQQKYGTLKGRPNIGAPQLILTSGKEGRMFRKIIPQ
jgi:hypothetical protein